jgi:hypothetical protein
MLILDHNGRKLGAKPAIPTKLCRALKLEHYVATKMTQYVPPWFRWDEGVPDSVDLNNSLGDCVVAAQAKMIRSWTANASGGKSIATITDDDILDVYKKGAGYDPADPSTDQGWDLLSALSYWQRIGIAGHKIGAYAAVNPQHHHMMRSAMYLFGGVYTAFDLPNSIWAQMDAGKPWDIDPDNRGSAGGHCVTIQAVATNNTPICLTWGKRQAMTWRFVDKYCTEAYAIISADYLTGGKTLAGLDVEKLKADLVSVQA